MNKKFLSLVLSLVMVLGTFTSVFAADSKVEAKKEEAKKTSPSAKIQWMVDQKLVEGRKIFKPGEEKNDLALDKNITRAEVTKMLVYAKGQEKLADLVKATSVPYSDVKADHWANGFVTVGTFKLKGPKGVAMLAGYPDGTFKPEKNVSYAELAKMLVALVKEDLTPQMVANAQWPGSWLTWAAELGILNGIEYANSNDPATRNLAFQMIYNAMYIYDTRHDVDYGTRIGVVSGYEDGKLIINQGDKQFKVTLDGKTTYTDKSGRVGYAYLNGTKDFARLYVGSLVEVITDKNEKDGVASHIMELGNPAVGATDGLNNRWYGVAEKTVQGVANVTKDNITVYTHTSNTWNIENDKDGKGAIVKVDTKDMTSTKAEFTADTRFFVADEDNGWLTEVDKTKARDLVEVKDGRFVPKVYVGYDVIGKAGRQYNKANIVVFNVVTDDQLNAKTFRVVNPTNRGFELTVENTKGEQTVLDMRSFATWFPGFNRPQNAAGYNDRLEKFDVISSRVSADNKIGKFGEVRIDYSEDPILRIKDVHKTYGQVTAIDLEGADNRVIKNVTIGPRAYQFLEGQLEVGKYVQIDNRDYTYNKNDISVKVFKLVKAEFIENGISVVNYDGRGLARVDGTNVNDETKVTAYFVSVEKVSNQKPMLTVRNVRYDNVDNGLVANGREFTFAISDESYAALTKDGNKVQPGQRIHLTIVKPAYEDIKTGQYARVAFDANGVVVDESQELIAAKAKLVKDLADLQAANVGANSPDKAKIEELAKQVMADRDEILNIVGDPEYVWNGQSKLSGVAGDVNTVITNFNNANTSNQITYKAM